MTDSEYPPQPDPEPLATDERPPGPESPWGLAQDTAEGRLLGLLALLFYIVFTLLPGSSTITVAWPWVFLWQVGLALPILWLLWQVWHRPLRRFALGAGLDGVVALAVVGLIVSTLSAEFRSQALWYAWAGLGGLAALYGLRGWFTTTDRVKAALTLQGYVALAFVGVSLILWFLSIYQPELARLQALQAYGVDAAFSFQFTSLRNWQPIGHQNYVAGYLVLVIPLFVGLAWTTQGRHRWVWIGATGLGLANLYTTSSRGGWLGLVAAGVVGLIVALIYSPLPRRWVLASGAGATALVAVLILSNNRLSQVLSRLASGNWTGGEWSYRAVTNAVGWNMGKSAPLTGLGPGSVPLVYQAYRPHWAGREAELQFQLHSTPAQLWGELGLWGVVVPVALIGVLLALISRWIRQGAGQTPSGLPPFMVWSLIAAGVGFTLLSLTDYQLDIIPISGVLGLYVVTLAHTLVPGADAADPSPQHRSPTSRWLAALGLGGCLAMMLWLVPIHRAWYLSIDGFTALTKQDLNRFAQRLDRAHQLAPWEIYYPYQLGWNLGDLSYQVTDNPDLRSRLEQDAIAWFERGNSTVPYQEFGHSNLGWLLIQQNDPAAAKASFQRSIDLLPAKSGVFFGLGFSCWQMGDRACAVDAFALELMRHPVVLTSPMWRFGTLAPLYTSVTDRLETLYGDLLAQHTDDPALTAFLHQGRGTLRWWIGAGDAAAEDWARAGGPVAQALLTLTQGGTVDPETLPVSPAKYAIAAWQRPDQRQALLEKAWVTQPEDLPQLADSLPDPAMIANLVASMDNATDFKDWLQRTAPIWQPRSERLGFGVLSRHIDGPTPSDFYPRVENIPMVKFFPEVIPSPNFFPA
ncbi:MAG: O-antigen ligase family protein, partial [Leptolyngbya sp.]|nr:O-antigen ligase family protein [Leptolyngbya sp.]